MLWLNYCPQSADTKVQGIRKMTFPPRKYKVYQLFGASYLKEVRILDKYRNAVKLLKNYYENTPIQIYWNFTTKRGKFSDKKFW